MKDATLQAKLDALSKRIHDLDQAFHALLRDAPWKHDKRSDGPGGNSVDEYDGAQRQMPVITPAPRDSKKSTATQNDTAPWWKQWKPWKRILGVIGIAAGIGYAITNYFQWRDLRHNFESDQRSMAKVSYTIPKVAVSDFMISVHISNVGKVPALRVGMRASIEVLKHDIRPSLDISKRMFGNYTSFLFPNTDSFDTTVPVFDRLTGVKRSLSPTEVGSLNNGVSYITIFGDAVYRDFFGVHWIRFCAWKSFSEDTTIPYESYGCVVWNAIGEGEPPEK
jgi:hypothetical protein